MMRPPVKAIAPDTNTETTGGGAGAGRGAGKGRCRGAPRHVQVGDEIIWDGETWTITAFDGTVMNLRARARNVFTVAEVTTVMFADDFAVTRSNLERLKSGDVYAPHAPMPLDGVPAAAVQVAYDREADILLAMTGYPVEHPDPDMVYDDSFDAMTVGQRHNWVAKKHDVSKRQVERWHEAHGLYGVAGLLDSRMSAQAQGLQAIPVKVRDEINTAIDLNANRSRPSITEIGNQARMSLQDQPHPEFPEDPERTAYEHYVSSERTFRRWVSKMIPGPWKLSTKSSRNAELRPVGLVPWKTVARPMEWVLLDSTPLDMFAMDPTKDAKESWQRVHLSLAIDVFSRQIVGWVFTVGEPRAEDIALLLYRIVSPKPAQDWWPAHGRWRYPGVPANLVFGGSHEVPLNDPTQVTGGDAGDFVAGVAFGHIDTFVVDHGKAYISKAIQEAAHILQTNLQLARIRTPTDKAHVEIVFNRIRNQFVMRMPGYKGPDIGSRGTVSEVEGRAFSFLWEIEDDFATWVACDYHNTPHRGLQFQSCPELDLTPNEAYDHGVTRSGLIPVPPPPNLLIEMLPTEWRTVQHYGIEYAGIRYDSTAGSLDSYRNLKSPWIAKQGKWKIKVDRSDRSRIWFWAVDLNHNAHDLDQNHGENGVKKKRRDRVDASIGEWVTLTWRGHEDAPLFTDAEVSYAKNIILGRNGNPRSTEVFELTLDRVLRRIKDGHNLPVAERQAMGQSYMRQFTSATHNMGKAETLEAATTATRTPDPVQPAKAPVNEVPVNGVPFNTVGASVSTDPGPVLPDTDDAGEWDDHRETSTGPGNRLALKHNEVEVNFFGDNDDPDHVDSDGGGHEDLDEEDTWT